MKDSKFQYFKDKIMQYLDKLESKEVDNKKELVKALIIDESLQKSGYPVGTIREWKGKKYIKIAPGKWRPKYDTNTKGAKLAIAALKRKAANCKDSKELMQLILENRDRFSDKNGSPLPFVKELSDYISGLNDEIESGNKTRKINTKTGEGLTKEEKEKRLSAHIKIVQDDISKRKESIEGARFYGKEEVERQKEQLKGSETALQGLKEEYEKVTGRKYQGQKKAQKDKITKQVKMSELSHDELLDAENNLENRKERARRAIKTVQSISDNLITEEDREKKIAEQKKIIDIADKDLKKVRDKLYGSNDDKVGITKKLREQLVQTLKPYFGKAIENFSTGIKSHVSKKTADKMGSEKAIEKSKKNGFTVQQHFEVANNIVELYKKAELKKTRPDKNNDPNIKSIKRFISPTKLKDGQDVNAYITIKESTEQGHKLYSVELTEINKASEKPDALGDATVKDSETATPKRAHVSDTNISQSDEKSSNDPEETEQEKHDNRSNAMKGNKNAYKGGPKEEPKTLKMQNIEELQDFAKSTYGIDITVENKKDFEQVKESFAEVERFCNLIPGLNQYIEKVTYQKLGKKTSGDYDHVSREMRIGDSETHTYDEDLTWARGGNGIEATTAHELGHAVQELLRDTGTETSLKESKVILAKQSKDIINEALKNLGLDQKRKPLSIRNAPLYTTYTEDGKRHFDLSSFNETEKAIIRLSIYGASDDGELVSEAFTDVLINGDKAQALSKEIYEITMQKIKEKTPVKAQKYDAAYMENKLNTIIDKASENNYSRDLLNQMVMNAFSNGSRSKNEFMDKYNIKTKNDINKYIENILDQKKVSIKETESDADFLNRIGIGKTGTVDSTTATNTNEEKNKTSSIETIRDNYKKSNSIDGDEDSITMPDGTELEGKWKLVEANSPTASHDESTFHKTEGFPTNEDGTTINDRDYEHDNAAQEAVLDIASDFDSRALGIDNPVVVSEDGVVISGNNRTMSSKIAAKNGTDKKYIDALNKKCKKFGFTQDDVSKFKNPRVVFETKVNGKYSTKQFAKFNQSGKKAQSPVEQAVKVAKTVTADTVESIAQKINEYDTLGELYADNKAMQGVFDTLITNEVIQKTDLPAYYTQEGGVSNNGKEFLETVLIGSVINENNIRSLSSSGGKAVRQKLVRAIVPLVENKGMKGYSINKELNEAVNIAVEVAKNHDEFPSVEEYAKQKDMFRELDPVAIGLAKKLEGTQKEFAEFMRDINGGLRPAANGESDIFLGGIESKDEIISRYLNIKKAVWEILNSLIA